MITKIAMAVVTVAVIQPLRGVDFTEFEHSVKEHHPETWFHIIGGNASREGLAEDLEAIAGAGISGIQFFHGQFGGEWPDVERQIPCLSREWDSLVAYVADECARLGLTFKLQNCPGWSMSGGPWIKPADAMRRLVHGRLDVTVGAECAVDVPLPRAERIRYGKCKSDEDADYRDICVLAFPTPEGDDCAGTHHTPAVVVTNGDERIYSFAKPVTVRTVEVSPFGDLDFPNVYVPKMRIAVEAEQTDGSWRKVADEDYPQSNWMYGWEDSPWFSIACDEAISSRFRVAVQKRGTTKSPEFRFLSAAHPDNWESLAGWTYRGLVNRRPPVQSSAAYVRLDDVVDATSSMSPDGAFRWCAPRPGRWTILRVGHVNNGFVNAPAPKEATGWECSKLEKRGAEANFAGYVGRLVGGPLRGKPVKGILIDSWECGRQTWSDALEVDFKSRAGYELRRRIPALFGWTLDGTEPTERFLRDWRRVLGELTEENYYGRMAELAHENGMEIQYETAFGDVIHGDILRFWKYADTPMCEFWQPHTNGSYVGTYNFKPVQPCVSSAHIYGKRRVAAESFTSFDLTWNENFRLLKGVADRHFARGVTHLVLHTYTHNPVPGAKLSPGSSFGSKIGTPFLRNQTWWKFMPKFTAYLARVGMMMERGKPCVDALWLLGDACGHKPDQDAVFPKGRKYDYINTDALMSRLEVRDGRFVLPDGMEYRVLWVPDGTFMEPATEKRVKELELQGGAVVRGDASEVEHALAFAGVPPDVVATTSVDAFDDFAWYHRTDGDAEIYFVSTAKKGGWKGAATFRARGKAEVWNPVKCSRSAARVLVRTAQTTSVALELPEEGSIFVVFRRDLPEDAICAEAQVAPEVRPVSGKWEEVRVSAGSTSYRAKFSFRREAAKKTMLDLGRVEAWAEVWLNGKNLGALWCKPYAVDATDSLVDGENELMVNVTSTWHNSLVRDACLPPEKRKTWTIAGPASDAPLVESGLLGPVVLVVQ